jgi:cobalt-zinc-cadmium efflux system outer membrane protein
MKTRSVAAGLLFGAAAMVLSRAATCADGPLMVSEARAIALGAERGPATREAAAPLRVASELHEASRALLPYAPRLTVVAGRRMGDFGAGPELGAGIIQDLSLRALASRRRDVGSAMQHSALAELERARLEGGALAALAWLDLLTAQELLQTRLAALRDAEEIARVAHARTDRGVALPIEASLAAAEAGAAELAQRDAEGRVYEARVALQFALGVAPGTDVVATGDLLAVAQEPPAVRAPAEHPAEVAARGRAALARADGKLARALVTPTLGFGINYAREGQGEQVITGTLVLPLPVVDPSRFDAARQGTYVAAAEAQEERVHAVVARDVAMTEHERLHTREVLDALTTKVLGPLRETVRLARSAYEAGTQDVTSFLLLRQRLVAAEEQLGRASADVQRADLRYELARGSLLARVSR